MPYLQTIYLLSPYPFYTRNYIIRSSNYIDLQTIEPTLHYPN